ncbi:hypothetical protein ON010_g15840 [Phytophthora cinnamomi]|nr:hypothetical protein ON010_g15840 [Phytophthora cinnamomi]
MASGKKIGKALRAGPSAGYGVLHQILGGQKWVGPLARSYGTSQRRLVDEDSASNDWEADELITCAAEHEGKADGRTLPFALVDENDTSTQASSPGRDGSREGEV